MTSPSTHTHSFSVDSGRVTFLEWGKVRLRHEGARQTLYTLRRLAGRTEDFVGKGNEAPGDTVILEKRIAATETRIISGRASAKTVQNEDGDIILTTKDKTSLENPFRRGKRRGDTCTCSKTAVGHVLHAPSARELKCTSGGANMLAKGLPATETQRGDYTIICDIFAICLTHLASSLASPRP